MYLTADNRVLRLSSTPNAYPQPGSTPVTSRAGTSGNDSMNSRWGEAMAGGLGDDTYNLWQAGATAVEKAGEGVDTVYGNYWGGVTLSGNIENLFLISAGATFGTGNALDNIIAAGTASARINGMAGNDVLVSGTGADIFIVAKGNGSDAIMGFQTGWDTISLQNYGVGDWATLSRLMTQTGNDVTISFANGEKLVIRDTALSALDGADFGLALDAPVAKAGYETLDKGSAITTGHGWYALNNVWGSSSLTEGTDYRVTSIVNKNDMTSGTSFTWSYPTVLGPEMTVRAYPEVAFGVSPHGVGLTNETHVFPIEIADIKGLTAAYDVSYQGALSGFNVAFDIWLTDRPYGDYTNITNEVMIWVHKGDFGAPGAVIGTYSEGGVTFTIYHKDGYTALIPDKDVPQGSIDVGAVLTLLNKLGVVSSSEYLASVEFGAEVASGSGSLTINNLDLTVTQVDASGHQITSAIDGKGVTTTVVDSDGGRVPAGAPPVLTAVLDASGAVISYEAVRVGMLSTQTWHYDAHKALLGSDVVSVDNGGATRTLHYDAAGTLLSSELVVPKATGVQTYSFNANGLLTGSVLADKDPSGSPRIIDYDAAGKVLGSVVTTSVDGAVTVTQYDANFVATARTLTGTDGADHLYGGPANNLLSGGAGDDILVGNVGADTLIGGAGKDSMRGGANADSFVFLSHTDSSTTRATADVILDFSAAEGDRIDLSAIDANIVAYGKQGFTFSVGVPLTPRAGALWLEAGAVAGSWELKGDIDGDGKADFLIDVRTTDGQAFGAESIIGLDAGETAALARAMAQIELAAKSAEADKAAVADKAKILNGTGATDIFQGGSGNDTLNGNAGNDTLYGNGGDDLLYGGAGADHLYGGADRDSLFGGAQNDDLYGDDGDDLLDGDAGNDMLDGGAGNDVAYGGAGDDILYGRDGDDRLYGGDGNDKLHGGLGADLLVGGAGDDQYLIEDAANIIVEDANGGNDTVTVRVDYTVGANVEKIILQGETGLTVTANASDNRIYAGTGGDTIHAGAGNDYVLGGVGNDIIHGDDGNDELLGGDGADILHGGAGDDSLQGGGGADQLYGGDGNDKLDGGTGVDIMEGGAGDDIYTVDNRGDIVIEGVNGGRDLVVAKINYTLGDNVENLLLQGSSGMVGKGNALDNKLTGTSFSDTLYGMAGDDIIIGGSGADRLYGGDGHDKFVYQAAGDSTVAAADHIVDFMPGDIVDLGMIDAKAMAAGNNSFTWLGTSAFTGAEGELRYGVSGGNAMVMGDINGDKIADIVIILDSVTSLSKGDFYL